MLNNNVKEGASEQEEVESREDERGDRVRVRYQMKTDTQYLVVVPTCTVAVTVNRFKV